MLFPACSKCTSRAPSILQFPPTVWVGVGAREVCFEYAILFLLHLAIHNWDRCWKFQSVVKLPLHRLVIFNNSLIMYYFPCRLKIQNSCLLEVYSERSCTLPSLWEGSVGDRSGCTSSICIQQHSISNIPNDTTYLIFGLYLVVWNVVSSRIEMSSALSCGVAPLRGAIPWNIALDQLRAVYHYGGSTV